MGADWEFLTRFNTTAGILESRFEKGFVGSFAPGVVLIKTKSRFLLEAGVSTALLSINDYGQDNLGGLFQFVSHIGIKYYVG